MHEDCANGIRLFELRVASCRWPLGDTWDQTEFFCGETAVRGYSWCPAHRKRAFSRGSWVGASARNTSERSRKENLAG
jgi:hypothetical protein